MNTQTPLAEEIQRYESYLKADPDNSLLWTNLGDLYHQAGQFDMAVACFEKVLQQDPNDMSARSRLGNVLISQHRFHEAELIYRSMVDQGDRHPVLLHNLGLTLFYQQRFEEARQIFLQAFEGGLHAPTNLAYSVYSLHKLNRTAEALELADRWLEQAPGPESEGYVSMLQMDHGDMEGARQRAESVLQQQPDNPDANVVMGTWTMEHQQAERALAHFQKAVEREPDNPRAWQGLGLVYMYRQDTAQAVRHLEKALELMPGHATNYLIIGWAKLAAKDFIGAEKAFHQAVAADRNFGEAHGALACALVFQGKIDLAKTEIAKARGLDPNGFGAVFAQSIILKLMGREEMGTKILAKLLEQSPLPRSKPLIEHIQDYLRTQGPAATPLRDHQPKT